MNRLKRAREFPTIVSDLVDIASAMPPKTVVIAGGDREGDLRLAEAARDHGLIKRVLLVGDPAEIRSAAEASRIPLQEADLIPSSSEEETAEHVVSLVQGKQVDIVLNVVALHIFLLAFVQMGGYI